VEELVKIMKSLGLVGVRTNTRSGFLLKKIHPIFSVKLCKMLTTVESINVFAESMKRPAFHTSRILSSANFADKVFQLISFVTAANVVKLLSVLHRLAKKAAPTFSSLSR
jgi:hypothetical protein